MSTVSIWLAVIFVILIVIYFYLTWNFDYWEKQGIPYGKPLPVLGNIQLFTNMRLEEIHMIHYKKYGRMFGLFEGRKPTLVVAEPDLLKQMMLRDCYSTFPNHRKVELLDKYVRKVILLLRDEEWKTVRRIITPALTSAKLKQMTGHIEEIIKRNNDYLESHAIKEETIDINSYFKSYLLDVVARCVFGLELDSLIDTDNSFLKHTTTILDSFNNYMPLYSLFPSAVKWIPFVYRDSSHFFEIKVKEIIELRKKKNQERKCFVDLLLQAQIDSNDKNAITEAVIISQCITFFLGGVMTSTTTLSFISYVLATHSEIQEKLIAEVDEAIENGSGEVSYEVVKEMRYLNMVVCEVLRMYPPVSSTDRECSVDNYKLGNATLNKSMLVIIPIYCIHHDEEFYPNSQEFDPDRFSPENEAKRNPFTFLPFGAGPRSCIGIRLAMMQIKLGLVHLLLKYRIIAGPQFEIPPKLNCGYGFHLSPDNIMVVLEKRNK